MTAEYHLIVRNVAKRGVLTSIDEYESEEKLIEAAADYQSGEATGEVVGAFTLTYDKRGLSAAAAITDLQSLVTAELATRPIRKALQNAMDRQSRQIGAL